MFVCLENVYFIILYGVTFVDYTLFCMAFMGRVVIIAL